ncbi:hypothetical protein GCM10022409_21520 [Hymenobacter glaciei]|uniref:Uncharacterized protein n=1 Tax=Hymenobacter glaciei TaxID=877209 RepID=A0ABP7U5F5_9BACT
MRARPAAHDKRRDVPAPYSLFATPFTMRIGGSAASTSGRPLKQDVLDAMTAAQLLQSKLSPTATQPLPGAAAAEETLVS